MILIYGVSGVSFTFYFGLMGRYLLYCSLCATPGSEFIIQILCLLVTLVL